MNFRDYLEPRFSHSLAAVAPAFQNTSVQALTKVTGSTSLPDTDPTTIQSILNLPQTFNNLANQLDGPATITGSAAPSLTIPATQLVVSINHLTPVIVDMPGGTYNTNLDVASALMSALDSSPALTTAFQTALNNTAPVSTELTAGIDSTGTYLTLQTAGAAVGSTLSVSDLVLASSLSRSSNGQLIRT